MPIQNAYKAGFATYNNWYPTRQSMARPAKVLDALIPHDRLYQSSDKGMKYMPRNIAFEGGGSRI